jgi:hypothetical protein
VSQSAHAVVLRCTPSIVDHGGTRGHSKVLLVGIVRDVALVFGSLAAVLLLAAFALIWRDLLSCANRAMRGVQPRLERVETYSSCQNIGASFGWCARVVFRNVPRRAGQDAVARAVSARLFYLEEDGTWIHREGVVARWRPLENGRVSPVGPGPELVDFDIASTPYEITIASKARRGARHVTVDVTHPRSGALTTKSLPLGNGSGPILALIWLTGENVDDRRWFRIDPNGRDGSLCAQPIDAPEWEARVLPRRSLRRARFA